MTTYSLVVNGSVAQSGITTPTNTATVSFGSNPSAADYAAAGWYVEIVPAFNPLTQSLAPSINTEAGTVTYTAVALSSDQQAVAALAALRQASSIIGPLITANLADRAQKNLLARIAKLEKQ